MKDASGREVVRRLSVPALCIAAALGPRASAGGRVGDERGRVRTPGRG